MTTNGETTALAVINEYPPERYNVLIPVKTIQEISPIHKVIINEVQIDPDPDKGKDVYREKNGELALTKKGLAKLMAAANIQIISSEAVTPSACKRCIEAAARTRLAPRCGDCPSRDDVAHQVAIAVPEPSGTWRMVRGTKELRMEDERKTMTEKQFSKFFPYRTEHCETKALNRALREGLMVSSTYTADELKKPFAVALVVPNMADPEMRKAVAARMAQGVSDLFGGNTNLALGTGDTKAKPDTVQTPGGRIVNKETGEVLGDIQDAQEVDRDQDPDDDLPPGFDFDEPEPIGCEGDECGGIITTVTDRQGNSKTPEEFAEWTMKRYGRRLCESCARKAASAAQRRGA